LQRFLDNVFTASGSALSDHYGVVVTLYDVKYDCSWFDYFYYYCPAEKLSLEEPPVPPQDDLSRLCAAVTED
jgi:hypothetical protein